MDDRRKTHTPKDSHYARLRRAHRDEKAGAPDRRSRQPVPPGPDAGEGLVRLYGLHTVREAIANPRRAIRRMLVTRNALERLEIADAAALPFPVEVVEPRAIDALVGSDAVHQGALIEARPLEPKPLRQLAEARLVVVLDQVTDPHNVGAVIRTAVALGAAALITTSRHSPGETGVLAKAASGALEHIDLIEVRNLAAAIEELHRAGFVTVGLDSDAPGRIQECLDGERLALVLGAEGKGLRQKTRETVSRLARLDMPGPIRSLNVSNAAAIALYAAHRHLDSR